MPAIVDDDPIGGGAPLSIFESGAILEYLADKTGQFLPKSGARRLQGASVGALADGQSGPMRGNANHFKNYAKTLTDKPEQLEYGTRRFVGEVDRLSGVMDAQLSVNRYLAGADYSIADMIVWPWAFLLPRIIDEGVLEPFPNLKRWIDEVGARPAVDKGRKVGRELSDRKLTAEEEEARKSCFSPDEREGSRRARGGREGGIVIFQVLSD